MYVPSGHDSRPDSPARRIGRRGLLMAGAAVAAAGAGAGLLGAVGGDRGPVGGEASPNVVLQWNQAALDAIRAGHLGPPVVARALAIAHTAMFDAWAAYDARAVGTQLGGRLRRPRWERSAAAKRMAVSYAACRALADLFPDRADDFAALLRRLGGDPFDQSEAPATPAGIGNLAASRVLAARHHDGANQLGDLHPGAYSDYSGYTPVNTPDRVVAPGRWQPLRVSDGLGGSVWQHYIAPFWGRVTPFALTSGRQFRPATGPATYSPDPSSPFWQQARRMLDYSAGLTDEQKVIAEYWADGPGTAQPPGHWCTIAAFVSRRDHHDLDADVKLYFALSNALFDAGIACWDAKRAYDSVRPITAIRTLFKGRQVRAWAGPYQGARLIDGGDWQPYQPATVVTPAFPEFVSGHSSFSRAAAEVLRAFTGADTFGAAYTQPAGISLVEPALPGRSSAVPAAPLTLSWATFSAAADQAALSRRLGGIHFPDGELQGRELGRQVGQAVWRKAAAHIAGTA